jgi:medium-chain acyl-[acyl-carrier-protein] hydrolase
MSDLSNSWFYYPEPRKDPTLRLFCFPPAAGLSSFFSTWPKYLPASIEVCVLELSNREQRLEKGACTELLALCVALGEALRNQLDRPFAFFGHCLGSLLAFETARFLHTSCAPLPTQLLLSGFPAPQALERLIHKLTQWLQLSDSELVAAILPPGNEVARVILQDTESMQIIAPLLRRDLTILTDYQPGPGEKLLCPFSLFGGWKDHFVDSQELAAWQYQTTGECSVHMSSGDHLFPQFEKAAFLQVLANELFKSGIFQEKGSLSPSLTQANQMY